MIAAALATSSICAVPLAVLGHRALRQQRAREALRLTTPNRILDERFVRIGGIEQWLSIRGEHGGNPVLMELHGGPGASNTIFAPRTRRWEQHFTLARWDMRGAGKTFGRSGAAGQGELSFARVIADGIEVADYLRRRCGQTRVILLASSFGSTFGLRLAHERPDLFTAYVGTDQNICEPYGVDPAYAGALARLRSAKRWRHVAMLEAMGADTRRWSANDWSTSAKIITGSDPRLAAVFRTVVMSSLWFSPQHRLLELADYAKAMGYSARLRVEAALLDARAVGMRFELPFFIFQGADDLLTPVDVAARYFAEVEAPVKEMAVIPGATHFAAYDQPDRFLELLLRRVLPALSS